MISIVTSTSAITYTHDGSCDHEWLISLGCPCPGEWEDRHLWGWACVHCYEQTFYPDACEGLTFGELAHPEAEPIIPRSGDVT